MPYDDLHPALSALARRPFTSGEADALGCHRWHLERLVAEGDLRRVMHGVYAARALADNVETRAQALRLVVPRHGVVVDRTAAWLWGAEVWSVQDVGRVPRLDVFVQPGRKRMTRPEVGGGERRLAAEDVCVVAGLTATTPVRTALDLACRLRRYDALAALDALARAQGFAPWELRAGLRRFRGRRGVVQARELVELVDGLSESTGETLIRLHIHDDGLPKPGLQVWVHRAGRPAYRLDLAYEKERVCVEYDGEEFHSSAEQRAADEARRAWLRAQGWIVIVVRKDDLRGPALFAWLRELRAALLARAA